MAQDAAQGVSATAQALKVFISYSRTDSDFANELVAGLTLAQFAPYIDKQDIAAGEDWQTRISNLIAAADTVLFTISPDSVASEVCAWEVEKALEFGKRVLPIVWRNVQPEAVPDTLKRLNYVYFDKPNAFGHALVALAAALNTDTGWIREHTRIGELAQRWDNRGRAEALLIRGAEIDDAKTWLRHKPKDAPEPTLLQQEFINESEKAELARHNEERQRLDQMAAATTAREEALKAAEIATENEVKASRRLVQRTMVGMVIAIGLALTAAGAAYYAFVQQAVAERESRLAEQQRKAAEENRRTAENQQRIAEQQRRIAERQTAIAKKQRDLLTPGPLIETKIGNVDAPIIMIEYSSMTCSHCSAFHAKTFPLIKKNFIDTGKILYVSREFPLDDLSMAAYMLARCKKTDRSFEIVQHLFRSRDLITATNTSALERLFSIAQEAEFTREQFEACLRDQELLDKLNWVRKRAHERLGINAVPTFFVNEYKISGNQPYAEFEKVFKTYIASSK